MNNPLFTRHQFIYCISVILLILTSLPTAVKSESIDIHYTITNKTPLDIALETFEELGYDASTISFSFYDFVSQTTYNWNEDYDMIAASTSKTGTAALYYQLIEKGYLTLDSQIPFLSDMYEEGAGNITNGTPQESYSLEELIYEMIYNSDNTAWNLLTHYYYQNYGDYEADLVAFSQTELSSELLWQFNHLTAPVLAGILKQIALDPLYQPIVDIMMDSPADRLLKTYVQENMGTKYGYLDTYYHDIGLFYIDEETPGYAIVVMTDQLYLEADGRANEFFGLLNLRLNRWFSQTHALTASLNQ